MSSKQVKTFKEVVEKTNFYTSRTKPTESDESDALSFYKETKSESNAWSAEFGDQVIHPDQVCWWYE